MNILGTVSRYDDLHRIMRARADELQISRQSLDALADLQPGYASKILAPVPMKKLTDETLGATRHIEQVGAARRRCQVGKAKLKLIWLAFAQQIGPAAIRYRDQGEYLSFCSALHVIS